MNLPDRKRIRTATLALSELSPADRIALCAAMIIGADAEHHIEVAAAVAAISAQAQRLEEEHEQAQCPESWAHFRNAS